MGRRQRVVIYGASVVLGAVRAGLSEHPRVEAIALAPPVTPDALAGLDPDVILFDAGSDCLGPASFLLCTRPDLLLIGVDGATAELVVLAGRPAQAFSIEELVRIIERKDSD